MKAMWAAVGTLGTLVGGLATNEIKMFNDNFKKLDAGMTSMQESVHNLDVGFAELKGNVAVQAVKIQKLEEGHGARQR